MEYCPYFRSNARAIHLINKKKSSARATPPCAVPVPPSLHHHTPHILKSPAPIPSPPTIPHRSLDPLRRRPRRSPVPASVVVCIVDLSGKVVKRIAGAAGGRCEQLLCTRLNLGCLTTDWNRCRVFSPATGAVHVLPKNPAAEHASRVNLRDPYTLFALGWIASTGEYKVLRMFNQVGFAFGGQQQLFEVSLLSVVQVGLLLTGRCIS
ncbi:hypothetical protein U9M48_012360 [Paspalum notatum var. saurae]|uniref:Uncharacterized protein n=1 Tax=Paspalum notatum var. saurae TaxID=547442 RepID=A0AAQ3SXC4_PASNO